eukprot:6456892-Amphidinium_carterae.2
MARMARLFRLIPELMVMVKGIAIATRSVMVTLTLLTLILYVFGITFTQLLRETIVGAENFKDVAQSMNTLLGYGIIMEDTPQIINDLGRENIAYGALFLLFMMMSSFTVLNMLVGVMVETTRFWHEAFPLQFLRFFGSSQMSALCPAASPIPLPC